MLGNGCRYEQQEVRIDQVPPRGRVCRDPRCGGPWARRDAYLIQAEREEIERRRENQSPPPLTWADAGAGGRRGSEGERGVDGRVEVPQVVDDPLSAVSTPNGTTNYPFSRMNLFEICKINMLLHRSKLNMCTLFCILSHIFGEFCFSKGADIPSKIVRSRRTVRGILEGGILPELR